MTAGTASRRMACRKNDGPPGSVCRDWESGRSPAFGNRLGQGLLTEHSIRSHSPRGSPVMENRRGCVVLRRQCRRLPQGADAGWAVPDFEGYLLLKPAMHPSGGFAASSPYRGAFPNGSRPKASPARGGGCAARRRRRGAAPRPANILLGRRILSAAAALRRAGSCCTLKDTHAAKRQCTPQSASPAITGLRSPHHAAHAEACLHSATAALPRSGKDRSGERRAILCFLSPNRR